MWAHSIAYIPQSSAVRERYKCEEGGRQDPSTNNYDQSTFVDAQKHRVQERLEGLPGCETPLSIDVHIECHSVVVDEEFEDMDITD